MPQILRSALADLDVLEIASFIAQDNLSAAERLIERFDMTLSRLAENPQLGTERSELSPKVRSFPVGAYLIFYQPSQDGIEVVRILHGARDLKRLFTRE